MSYGFLCPCVSSPHGHIRYIRHQIHSISSELRKVMKSHGTVALRAGSASKQKMIHTSSWRKRGFLSTCSSWTIWRQQWLCPRSSQTCKMSERPPPCKWNVFQTFSNTCFPTWHVFQPKLIKIPHAAGEDRGFTPHSSWGRLEGYKNSGVRLGWWRCSHGE